MNRHSAISLIAIAGALLGVSCYKATHSSNAPVTVQPPASGSPKSFLALGDSYTIGQSVPSSQSFPFQTQQMLGEMGVMVGAPEIIATTGWTTDNLSTAIVSRKPAGPYDVVTLLIGVNDQYQRHDTIGYRMKFTALLQTSIQLAGDRRQHVFVLSIPDYSVTPFAMYYDTASIRRQIDWFNAINKEVTAAHACIYLDITPSTREAAADRTLLASDGLHPSGKEYGKWAMKLGALIKTSFQ